MSNVIAFLEAMGREAVLRPASAEYDAAVATLDVDDAARSALLAADAGTLGDLLGGRPKMICMLFPAEDKPDEEQPAEDEPAQDDTKESVRH